MATLEAFVFNEAGFHHFLTDTSGELAHTLEGIAEAVAVKAQENVGRDWSGSHVASNPPPGPPYRRSGDLQASIRATPATVFAGVMESAVIADATHRGFAYPIWLRIQGYRFVDLEGIAGI